MKRVPVCTPYGLCLVALTGIVVAACGPGAPAPAIYVLVPPAKAVDKVEPLAGQPLVEVRPVLVPDYLDISEIMVRRAENVVTPSTTGRWGERLSVGVTRALTQDLQRRLPGVVVADRATYSGRFEFQVLTTLDAFDARADGTVVLAARWQLIGPANRHVPAPERISVTQPGAQATDAAIAASMGRAVDQLAARIADTIRIALPRTRAR